MRAVIKRARIPERDWQKDWELCQQFKPGAVVIIDNPSAVPIETYFAIEAREALLYWLQRVRDLEERVQQLEAGLRGIIDCMDYWTEGLPYDKLCQLFKATYAIAQVAMYGLGVTDFVQCLKGVMHKDYGLEKQELMGEAE